MEAFLVGLIPKTPGRMAESTGPTVDSKDPQLKAGRAGRPAQTGWQPLHSAAGARKSRPQGSEFADTMARLQAPPDTGAAPAQAEPFAQWPARAPAVPERQGTALDSTSLPVPPQHAALAARQAMAVPVPQALLRSRLAEAEGTAREPGQGYGVRNRRSGALGRYQFLPIALRDIGWQGANGAWTPRAHAAGVRSVADFLAKPAAQEAAMAEYLGRAEQQLAASGALSRAGQALRGMDGRPIRLTETGLVAAAHRRGAGAVASWIRHRAETPQAPLSAAQKSMFNSIEIRLRDFADLQPGGGGVDRVA